MEDDEELPDEKLLDGDRVTDVPVYPDPLSMLLRVSGYNERCVPLLLFIILLLLYEGLVLVLGLV
jgi:hypothetical protein